MIVHLHAPIPVPPRLQVSESVHRTDLLKLKGSSAEAEWTAGGRERLRARVIADLRKSGMLPPNASIASVWDTRLEYGYPVPYVERNMHVHAADAALRALGIWSRGRFGSWKYEVANQVPSAAAPRRRASHARALA
ncbi:MAG: hypothetical protein CBD47_09475 [Synechococcus sp. TMED187]|nr:MAG: hypothetical protein CBD47_09475 [Synechococcus sp. TMED187]